MSDRESFREPRNRARVIHEAAKLARSKAVAENLLLRLILRGMDDLEVAFAEDPKDGAMITVEGVAWFDKPTAEAFQRLINELRQDTA